MELVVRSTEVPTADLQSTPIPLFQAASPSPIQARSDWAALRWWGKAPGLSGCFAT
jgi:hypothetical protein